MTTEALFSLHTQAAALLCRKVRPPLHHIVQSHVKVILQGVLRALMIQLLKQVATTKADSRRHRNEKNARPRLIKDLSAEAEKPAQPHGARHGRNSCLLLNPINQLKRPHRYLLEEESGDTPLNSGTIQSGNTAVLRE